MLCAIIGLATNEWFSNWIGNVFRLNATKHRPQIKILVATKFSFLLQSLFQKRIALIMILSHDG